MCRIPTDILHIILYIQFSMQGFRTCDLSVVTDTITKVGIFRSDTGVDEILGKRRYIFLFKWNWDAANFSLSLKQKA